MTESFKQILAKVIAVMTMLALTFGGGRETISKTVESGEKSTNLTQTSVVLSETKYGLNYYNFFKNTEKGFIIPGLYEGFIPQGIFYEESQDIFLISGYYENNELRSRIILVNGNGEFVKSVGLMSAKGNYAYGHFGGISVFGDNIYVASISVVHVLSLEKLLNAENDSYILVEGSLSPDIGCSYTNVSDGVLYIGEFLENKSDNPRCNAYILDENCKYAIKADKIDSKNQITADYTIYTPAKVQGTTKLSNGKIAFSASYELRDSTVYVYDDVTERNADGTLKSDGAEIPYYKLTRKDLSDKYTLPPYIEEIALYSDGRVLLISESAADPYRQRLKTMPIDYVMCWDIESMR